MAKVPELIVLGCGSRGTGYAGFVKKYPDGKAMLIDAIKNDAENILDYYLG